MKRFFSLLILLASLFSGYQILSIWRGVHVCESNISKEGFLKAIRLHPSNPDPYYRLGLYYQWDLHSLDLNESLRYLRSAAKRNPLAQEYWLDLAKVSQKMGENGIAQRALENAVQAFSTGYRGRWVAGNLLLEQGDLLKALPHFSYILAHYPNKSTLVFDVWRRAIHDSDFILQRLIAKDPSSLNLYLAYLYEVGDTEAARGAWKEKTALCPKTEWRDVQRHVDFLISKGKMIEAHQVWEDKVREEGGLTLSEGNAISHGGFEEENIFGGGFAWRKETVPGAEISLDPSVSFEGKRSLEIVFNGRENVDFQHVFQYVMLRADTDYVLTARIKTQAVTTKSGIKIEVLGLNLAFSQTSDSLTGDNDWKEVSIHFRTPPGLRGGLVRLRREKTDHFDKFISGTVWIDDIRLTERH